MIAYRCIYEFVDKLNVMTKYKFYSVLFHLIFVIFIQEIDITKIADK